MPFNYRNEIDIRAPAKKVFAALSDPRSFVHFVPMVRAARLEPEGAMRRGTRVHIDGPNDSNTDKPMQFFVDVTDFVPDRVIEFSGPMTRNSKSDGYRGVTRYELERYGAITRLIAVTSHTRLGWWSERLFPLIKPLMRWFSGWMLKKFKTFLESAP